MLIALAVVAIIAALYLTRASWLPEKAPPRGDATLPEEGEIKPKNLRPIDKR